MHKLKTTCCYCGVGCGVLIATDGSALEIMQRAQPLLESFEFATLGLRGGDDPVVVLHAAAAAPAASTLIAAIDRAFALADDAQALTYRDFARGIFKRVVFGAGRLDQLRARLKCGTGCGSCVPELKRLAENRIEDRGSSQQIAGARIEPARQSSTLTAVTQSSILNPQS